MNSNISIKDNEFYFTKKNREGIKDVQMLADILETFRKEYFHFKDPITLAELKKIASNTQNSYYRNFFINKKNGGKRLISIPNKRLKEIQSCIRVFLTGPNHHGRSIIQSAIPHICKDIVYNIDIKDFYPSINSVQITSRLISIGFKYDIAILISSLATMRTKEGMPVLPQGAPSSPILAELVMKHLDSRLIGFATKHRFDYSRYVDDITFSCSKSEPWYMYAKMFKRIIQSEGFTINERKCRVSFYYQRQEVVGLTVNKKINVTSKYIKQLRTIIHNWEKDGYVIANNKFMINYLNNKTNPKRAIPKIENFIDGKLAYLNMVRSSKRVKKKIYLGKDTILTQKKF